MKNFIIILMLMLFHNTMVAQEFQYFNLMEEPTTIASFETKDKPLSILNIINWRSSYFRDADWEKIKALEKDKFKDKFKDCSQEEIEALKTIRILFFLDEQLNVLSSNLIISSEYVWNFSNIEKYVYHYIRSHSDLKYMKPYLVIPEDFTGATFRASLNWLFE